MFTACERADAVRHSGMPAALSITPARRHETGAGMAKHDEDGPHGTVRFTVDKDALFGPGGFARITRCCTSPLPHVGMAVDIQADSKAQLYCRNCRKIYGVFAWKTKDPRL